MNKQTLPVIVLALVVVLGAGAWLLPQLVALQAQVDALQQQASTLQAQATAAQDYVDVANLQASYGYYVDKSRWDDAADLFAADATLEIAGRGLFTGQPRIREYLNNLGALEYGRMYNHLQLQPVIHVADDGLSAQARWRSFMMVGHLGEEARWGEATYENAYVKDNGVWKISKLHSYIGFYVDYDTGWNKGAVEMPKQFDNLTPDGEPTVVYGSYPDIYIAPYHYKNPVSGREYTP
jgi:hypothetical protein